MIIFVRRIITRLKINFTINLIKSETENFINSKTTLDNKTYLFICLYGTISVRPYDTVDSLEMRPLSTGLGSVITAFAETSSFQGHQQWPGRPVLPWATWLAPPRHPCSLRRRLYVCPSKEKGSNVCARCGVAHWLCLYKVLCEDGDRWSCISKIGIEVDAFKIVVLGSFLIIRNLFTAPFI